MTSERGLLLLAAGVLTFAMLTSGTASPNGEINLSSLISAYGSDSINRLNAIYSAMLNNGWTTQQCLFGLSQVLHESGLFTDQGNYSLMNQNNYAGLTNVNGGYASYSSVQDFVNHYENFLTKGSDPLGASSLIDFNNRLVANHYYTDSPVTYLNDMQNYYNLLSQTI